MAMLTDEDVANVNGQLDVAIRQRYKMEWERWCKEKGKNPNMSRRDQSCWDACSALGPAQLNKLFNDPFIIQEHLKIFMLNVQNGGHNPQDLQDIFDGNGQQQQQQQPGKMSELEMDKLFQKVTDEKEKQKQQQGQQGQQGQQQGQQNGQGGQQGGQQGQQGQQGGGSDQSLDPGVQDDSDSLLKKSQFDQKQADLQELQNLMKQQLDQQQREQREHQRKALELLRKQVKQQTIEKQKVDEQQAHFNATIHVPPFAPAAPPAPPSDITDLIICDSTKHNQASTLRKILRARDFPLLWGAPGSGKTHLCQSIAEDMRLDFLLITLTQDSMRSESLGNKSPFTGKYFPTKFREVWEFGGVALYDEIGLGNGGLVNLFNAAMAQGYIDFPDGKGVKRHENCFLLFADNSNLRGNDLNFPERQDLGSAFRDRLTYLKFEYDEKLELKILCSIWGDVYTAKTFQKKVIAIRKILKDQSVPCFASPRFSFRASRRLNEGFSWTEICHMELWQGLDEDTVKSAEKSVLHALGG